MAKIHFIEWKIKERNPETDKVGSDQDRFTHTNSHVEHSKNCTKALLVCGSLSRSEGLKDEGENVCHSFVVTILLICLFIYLFSVHC